jgi:hypothetical protein
VRSGATAAHAFDDTERLLETDVDPELERQLASAKDDEPVEAVLVLRQNSTEAQRRPNPKALLRRLYRDEPVSAVECTVLPRLGVLIVRAQARVIRRLIAQPAVAIASANRITGTAEGEPLRLRGTLRSRSTS